MRTGRLVDFIICGAQKSGTTALDSYLREHPDICMAENKEVHFFDNESFFESSKPDYKKYHSSFRPNLSQHDLVGEATPIYMYWKDAAKRIWEYNPNMKLIVLLRNPIERAYSHWNMERSRNAENLSFIDAIRSERKRCREALPLQHRVYSYIDRGYYLEQLRRLWHYFSKNNVLILKSDYLRNRPEETLKEVCKFLDVNNFESVDAKDVHSRQYLSKMSDKEKKYLKYVFEYEIKGIERELGWDCSDWLNE